MEDFLGLGLGSAVGSPAWPLPDPEPTNLIAPWPGADAPDAQTLGPALAQALDASVDVDTLAPPEPDIDVMLHVRSAALPLPLLLWCEPARGAAPRDLGPETARAARVLGIEAVLDPTDPLTGYTALLRLVARLEPALPAVLDVNTGLWRGREMLLRQFAETPVEPRADTLWMIQAVGGTGGIILRTIGLHRCGRPELELLGVPAERAPAAMAVLGDLAGLLLETTAWPAPGEPFEIGVGLRVALRPADEVARAQDDAVPRAGPTAVVCTTEPGGEDRGWPVSVVDLIDRGASAIYRAPRASRRQAELARVTWPRLLSALAGGAGVEAIVEAGFETADGAREHVWFAVHGVVDDEIVGRLAHAPSQLGALEPGRELRLRREVVSDWCVRSGRSEFGPDDIDALEAAIAGRAGSAP